ncbi:hypothetical protein BGY98DRAFT_737157 [Russula aff. rugulosa BPL654]|nr:hypothetical protein BGY98DRAFT_737157 [Russula aff. rugulosa BPL654]
MGHTVQSSWRDAISDAPLVPPLLGSLRPPHRDGIRVFKFSQILAPAHSPVRTPGGHSGWHWHLLPAFSSLYAVACTPAFTLYIVLRSTFSPRSFPMGQRRGHTDACHFSQLRTVGQSDRTPSTPIHFAATNHDSRFANTVLYCITVIASRFTQRGGTNSCSQTLAPRVFLVSEKKMAPWNSEPPMTPLGSSNPGSTHCQVQSSRWKGLSTEFFYKPNPGLGHAHTIRLMVMSRSRRVFRVVHPPRCIHSGIFVLFSLGLHAARIINAGSLIRGSSVLLYGV